MPNVRVTDRAVHMLGIRHIETGNTGHIYHDFDDCKDNISRWYRVMLFDGQRLAHSTRQKSVADGWFADFREGLGEGDFVEI